MAGCVRRIGTFLVVALAATAVQAALVGQATPKAALDAAQGEVDGVMKQ